MNKRVFNFDLDGQKVLGFDMGLGPQAFAQAKMAAFITDPGFIVFPDGRVETWRPGGVTERETMFVWGPSFPGEELAAIIDEPDRKDEALRALCFWLRAGMILRENPPAGEEVPFPGPAGAYVVSGEAREAYPEGTVFFPPARLLKRTIEAASGGDVFDAGSFVHPDLEGAEAAAFSAGAALYRIFSGAPPYARDSGEELRQDIREAVFLPPNLAAPGLDPEMCALITRAISRVPQNREEKTRPAPDFIYGFLNSRPEKTAASWIKPLSGEALAKIRAEQKQHSKKAALTVKTRRFVIRNTAIITGIVIGVIVLAFSVRGYVKHLSEQPTTLGMTPLQVAETYYNAFGTLDHTLMDACVIRDAGKRDVEMVINLFVISRMRQAYETTGGSFSMSAEEWTDAGRPATDKTVFGVTDLNLKVLSESATNVSLEADYILWMPGAYLADAETEAALASEAANPENEESSPLPPGGTVSKDRLSLVFEKDSWHIAEIERESKALEE